MTDTNRYGPSVSWRDARRWAIAGIGLWFPAYLRDAERHEGILPGYCDLPVGFRETPQTDAAEAVTEVTKHPEQRLPLILVIIPGMAGVPVREADRKFSAPWEVVLLGLVHGKTEADAELVASCYGLALSLMMIQQGGEWANLPGYLGPSVEVDTVEHAEPALDFIAVESTRRRSVVAARATFTVVFRNSASSLGPQTPPPVDPSVDPGDWPEVIETELQIDREGIS